MNYKDTLYFISKCLTVSLQDSNRHEIEKQLKSNSLNWDSIVEISTAHLVFPALYCNLKCVDFLKYLPKDLVSYMEHITKLNRERNEEIINQAKELNTLLLVNNITPIFLKGTGNLLVEIYDDIAERMIGDIDFIVSKEDYKKSIKVLKEFGYCVRTPFEPSGRHYPRLIKKDRIACVEIHKDLLSTKHVNEFNYSFIAKDSQVINGFRVLSYANKINLSIISNQINDNGFYYKTIALRNAYDVFLLSKKTNVKEAINSLDGLSHPLNCFLAACCEVFTNVESLEYNNTKKTASYLSDFKSQFTNPVPKKVKSKLKKINEFTKIVFNVLFNSIIYKEYLVLLFKNLTSLAFYKRRLGIK
jgi:hypothetical protein